MASVEKGLSVCLTNITKMSEIEFLNFLFRTQDFISCVQNIYQELEPARSFRGLTHRIGTLALLAIMDCSLAPKT